MSLIVEPTLAYTSSHLKIDDPKRWSRLFPLIRPSVKVLDIQNSQTLVVDTKLADSKNVLVAVIGTAGNFPSKLLSDQHVAAFAIEPFGPESISAKEVVLALKDEGFPTENGTVLLRASTKQNLIVSSDVVEVSVIGELKLDHILSLLTVIEPEVKNSLEKTQALLEQFVKSAARTTSKFHEKKTEKGPSVVHAVDFAEFNSAKIAVQKDLGHLLGSRPSTGGAIYSIHCADINGLSRLENNILIHEISEFCAQKELPVRISHSTILDNHSQARGWAISLCAIPTIFLTARTEPVNTLANSIAAAPLPKPHQGSYKLQLTDSEIRKMIISGCDSVIEAEPAITEYDTAVGDGDCGYTLRDGAKHVLSFIERADLAKLPSTLGELVDDLEVSMGGTSGALYCIFLSALSQELWTAATFANAMKGALDHLLKYTRARLEDRTCLDCLIPFVEALDKSGDAKEALKEAEKGVESTKTLEAKLGRSSYLDEQATRGVPDPGAYGLLMLLRGIVAGL